MITDPDSRPAPPVPQSPPRRLPSWLLALALSLVLVAGWGIYIHFAPAPQPAAPGVPAPIVASPAVTGELRVLVWRNTIDPQIFTDFEGESGVKIVREDYDTNEQLTALMDQGHVTHDLALVSGIDFKHLLDRDLLQPMLPVANRSNVDATIAARTTIYDPENRHGLVAVWGNIGIGYDAIKLSERLGDAPIDSWATLFNTESAAKLKDCGIQIVDSPRGVFPIALTFLNLPPDSAKPEDTDAAARVWEGIRPFISTFTSQGVAENLADGKTCLALATSGDVYRARMRNPAAASNLRYVIPKEGSIAWYGLLAVPKAAANTTGASKLIDFLLRPEVAARLTNTAGVPTAVHGADIYVRPELKGDPTLFPDASAVSRLTSEVEPSAAAAALRNRFWQLINAPPMSPAAAEQATPTESISDQPVPETAAPEL